MMNPSACSLPPLSLVILFSLRFSRHVSQDILCRSSSRLARSQRDCSSRCAGFWFPDIWSDVVSNSSRPFNSAPRFFRLSEEATSTLYLGT